MLVYLINYYKYLVYDLSNNNRVFFTNSYAIIRDN